MPDSDAYGERAAAVVGVALELLSVSESLSRWLHPRALPRFAELLAPIVERAEADVCRLRDAPPPAGWEGLHRAALAAGEALLAWGDGFRSWTGEAGDLESLLRSFSHRTRALEALYALRAVHPAVARFFVEPPLHGRVAELDPEPPPGVQTGLHSFQDGEAPGSRGGFSLYVPETYDGREAWPLVVGLHGGAGGGRDFVWTWLREARSRRFILMAPTSLGRTWSLLGGDLDAEPLHRMLQEVREQWNVDRKRVLLTGFSDGATYTLLVGLREDSPFTHLAPISGVFHPRGAWQGNLKRARGRRIYLVHGALDWMFPVGFARVGRDVLQEHGADLVYRELEDLPHAYPREENARILEWFDASLAL